MNFEIKICALMSHSTSLRNRVNSGHHNDTKQVYFKIPYQSCNLELKVTVILGTSNRIPTRGAVVMYTSCHDATIVMTNCIIVSQKCSSAYYYGIWCHNSTNWCHNSSTMTTCNRTYTWLPCIQQQMLFEVLTIVYTIKYMR